MPDKVIQMPTKVIFIKNPHLVDVGQQIQSKTQLKINFSQQ